MAAEQGEKSCVHTAARDDRSNVAGNLYEASPAGLDDDDLSKLAHGLNFAA